MNISLVGATPPIVHLPENLTEHRIKIRPPLPVWEATDLGTLLLIPKTPMIRLVKHLNGVNGVLVPANVDPDIRDGPDFIPYRLFPTDLVT